MQKCQKCINDILEPSSGRKYTKIVLKNKRFLLLVFLSTIFDRLEEISQIEMFDPNKRKEKKSYYMKKYEK